MSETISRIEYEQLLDKAKTLVSHAEEFKQSFYAFYGVRKTETKLEGTSQNQSTDFLVQTFDTLDKAAKTKIEELEQLENTRAHLIEESFVNRTRSNYAELKQTLLAQIEPRKQNRKALEQAHQDYIHLYQKFLQQIQQRRLDLDLLEQLQQSQAHLLQLLQDTEQADKERLNQLFPPPKSMEEREREYQERERQIEQIDQAIQSLDQQWQEWEEQGLVPKVERPTTN